MKFEFKRLNENIFCLYFEDSFDLALHFLRWTERKENEDFKNQNFSIVDFISAYSKKRGGVFTYAKDWVGFNLTNEDFEALPFSEINDWNKCDEFMQKIIELISLLGVTKFSLIGCALDDLSTLEHELAHSLYHLNSDYRKEMNKNLKNLGEAILNKVLVSVQETGYDMEVSKDEAQAYLSTGLSYEMEKFFRKHKVSRKIRKPFVQTFKKYRKDLLC